MELKNPGLTPLAACSPEAGAERTPSCSARQSKQNAITCDVCGSVAAVRDCLLNHNCIKASKNNSMLFSLFFPEENKLLNFRINNVSAGKNISN